MIRQLSLLVSSTALAGMISLALPGNVQAVSLKSGSRTRAPAITSPVDHPDVPGPGAVGPKPGPWLGPHAWGTFYPYYSPVIPVSKRWRYHKYTPYYPGYCRPWGKHPPMYGSEDWLGLGPDAIVGPGAITFGPYTGAPQNETVLLHLGGTGLTPPPPPESHEPGAAVPSFAVPAVANPLPPLAPVGARKQEGYKD